MEATISTPKGTRLYSVTGSAFELLEFAKKVVAEAESKGMEISPTLKSLREAFPGKEQISVTQAVQYVNIGRYTLMNDNRFYKRLIKPGKSASGKRNISLANFADYLDGR